MSSFFSLNSFLLTTEFDRFRIRNQVQLWSVFTTNLCLFLRIFLPPLFSSFSKTLKPTRPREKTWTHHQQLFYLLRSSLFHFLLLLLFFHYKNSDSCLSFFPLLFPVSLFESLSRLFRKLVSFFFCFFFFLYFSPFILKNSLFLSTNEQRIYFSLCIQNHDLFLFLKSVEKFVEFSLLLYLQANKDTAAFIYEENRNVFCIYFKKNHHQFRWMKMPFFCAWLQ